MKLRNKKTGEIKEAEARDDGIYLYSTETEQWFKYGLDVLAEYWKYYVEPKEPLIKDEKIRKAVRVWAEANRDVYRVAYFIDHAFYKCCLKDTDSDAEIIFNFININGIEGGKTYTITELCG